MTRRPDKGAASTRHGRPTDALKPRSRGAKWGANMHRHVTAPGRIWLHEYGCDQALSHAGRWLATIRTPFASRGTGVQIPSAPPEFSQVRGICARQPTAGSEAMSESGSQNGSRSWPRAHGHEYMGSYWRMSIGRRLRLPLTIEPARGVPGRRRFRPGSARPLQGAHGDSESLRSACLCASRLRTGRHTPGAVLAAEST